MKIIKKHGVYLKALYGEEIRPVGSRFVAGSYGLTDLLKKFCI